MDNTFESCPLRDEQPNPTECLGYSSLIPEFGYLYLNEEVSCDLTRRAAGRNRVCAETYGRFVQGHGREPPWAAVDFECRTYRQWGCDTAPVHPDGVGRQPGLYRICHVRQSDTFVSQAATNPFFVPTRYGPADAANLLGCQYQWLGTSTESVVPVMVQVMNIARSREMVRRPVHFSHRKR